MPVQIIPLGNGRYQVRTPNRIHARSTTRANADRQAKIINAADAGHPFTGKKRKRGRS